MCSAGGSAWGKEVRHTAKATTTNDVTAFTTAQWQALAQLRERSRQGCDFLSGREVANLCFARWLYQTGRVEPVLSEKRITQAAAR